MNWWEGQVINALDDQASGKATPVDWWFMYKLPHEHKAHQKATSNGQSGETQLSGTNYLYYDASDNSALKLSPHLLGKQGGALDNTLRQVFDAAEQSNNSVGWLLYNDERPDGHPDNDLKGHCKGILAFDPVNDTGLWLLHSTPRYPAAGEPLFPDNEKIYAQTFICITLESYAAVNQIASQLRAHQEPQVYAHKLPDAIPGVASGDEIYKLCMGERADRPDEPSIIDFKSKSGKRFKTIAKNRHWAEDFWIDLVGPTLGVDLSVETWRRGKIPSVEDSDNFHSVTDVSTVDLTPINVNAHWHYTKDHAKWAASLKPQWTCVADINRQISQEKRGGGSICFEEQALWQALDAIEVVT